MAKETQVDRVLARMRKGPLTQMEATIELGVMRLAARVMELRADGIPVKVETIEVPTRITGETAKVARYSLPPCDPHDMQALPGDGWGSRQCKVCGLVALPQQLDMPIGGY